MTIKKNFITIISLYLGLITITALEMFLLVFVFDRPRDIVSNDLGSNSIGFGIGTMIILFTNIILALVVGALINKKYKLTSGLITCILYITSIYLLISL